MIAVEFHEQVAEPVLWESVFDSPKMADTNIVKNHLLPAGAQISLPLFYLLYLYLYR